MSSVRKRWKAYPAYKNSGEEWLGQVPKEWEVKRLRFLVATNPSKAEVRLSSDDFVSFVPMETVGEYGGMQCQERCLDEIGSGYTYFADGDILIAKITPCFENVKGAIAENLTNGIGFGSTEFHVVRPLSAINTVYCFWVSISYIFRKVGEAHMYGAGGQKRIPDVFIKNFHLPTPPLPEQHAIAAFLDQQCAQIDSLIEKKQRILGLLDEKRRAVITQAVTRGLDPTVPMKDSGVEWLGEVPEGWKVGRVAFGYDIVLGKMLQPSPNSEQDVAVPYYRAMNVQWESIDSDLKVMWATPEEIKTFSVRQGDMLVCEGGEVGRAAIINLPVDEPTIIQNALHRVRAFKDCHIGYLLRVLEHVASADWFSVLCNKSTIAHFTGEKFKALKCPLPPLPEQQAIADYLDAQCAAMDSQRKNLEKSIELLREYRASLITHAVTGKIDVRDVAPLQ